MRPPLAVAAWLLATSAAALAPAPASAGVRPQYGGELSFVVPFVALPTLDPLHVRTPADLAAVRAAHATLLESDGAGVLRPTLLEVLPEAEESGKAWHLRLASGARFQDGTPLLAADAAASLARLAGPDSPHAWLLAAVEGADALRDGRASTLSGLQVISDRELRVTLSYPFPDFPRALAAAPAAIVRVGPGGALTGAGPFRATPLPGPALKLVPFDAYQDGRPLLDLVLLSGGELRSRQRPHQATVVLRPEGGPEGAPLLETGPVEIAVAVVSRRLGAAAEPARRALVALDRVELARLVRAPVTPLATLLPASLLAALPPPSSQAPGAAPGMPSRLTVLLPEGDAVRAAAERIQLKLYDRGVRVAVERAPRRAFEARLVAGDFDVALFSVPLLARTPALALAQLAAAIGGPERGASVLARAAAAPAELGTLATALEPELLVVPLYAAGRRLWAPARVRGLALRDDGTLDLAAAWLWSPRGSSR